MYATAVPPSTHTHPDKRCASGRRFGGLFILNRDASTVYQGHPLNNRPFYAPLFPRLPHATPSIWPFMLTLFLTPLLSRTQSGTGREDGAGARGRRRKCRGVGVCLLGEIKCNFTVNLLWYIISQQWDVGWYNPSWHLYRAVRMSAMALWWCRWYKADVGGVGGGVQSGHSQL